MDRFLVNIVIVPNDIGRDAGRKCGNPAVPGEPCQQAMQIWDGVKPQDAIPERKQQPNEVLWGRTS